jgi:hypothetical protein
MAFLKTLPLYAVLALATACSQVGVKASPPVVTESRAQQPAEAGVAPATDLAAQAAAEAALPKQPLTSDILFKFLVAEVAGQRGQIGIAESTYLDLAADARPPHRPPRRRGVDVCA